MSIKDYIEGFAATESIIKLVATSGYVIGINIRNTTPEVLEHTYPAAWWTEYNKETYVRWDPTIHWAFRNEGRIRWSELEEESKKERDGLVLKRAAHHGLKYGICFSKYSEYGEKLKSIFEGARPDREFTNEEIEILWEAFERSVHTVENKEILPAPQKEVLRLIAMGLSQKEVALRLNKSPETIKVNLAKAKSALKAHSTGHAIAIGIHRKLIRLPDHVEW